MNRLKKEKRLRILELYLEGCSIRAIKRMTGVHSLTVSKFLNTLGYLCGEYIDGVFQNLAVKDVQVDELWTFIGKREKNWRPGDAEWKGNVFIWTALCADSRLLFSWHLGRRNAFNTDVFLSDLANRLGGPVRITSDSYDVYRRNINDLFPHGLEYFTRVKGDMSAKFWKMDEPGQFIKIKAADYGVHTNYVEKHNGTMRLHLKRLQRASNCNSKSVHALCSALNLYAYYYNFVRVHQTLRVTPAMEARLAVRVFSFSDMLKLLEEHETQVDADRLPRGPYKKRTGKVLMMTPGNADIAKIDALHERTATATANA